MTDYLMPSLGADMEDGRVVEWFVHPGDTVRRGDIVGVVDTAKGAIEIEIWLDGVVREIVVAPGTKVPVGALLLRLESPGDESLQPTAAPGAGTAATVPASPAPEPRGLADASKSRGPPTPAGTLAEPRASPAARREAKRRGVDLAAVRGSGPGGAIVLGDLGVSIEQKAAETPAVDRLIAMRTAIAAAMARSKREIPHYYLASTVNMRVALQWLESRNEGRPPEDRMLPVTLFLKAVATAVPAFKEFNGYWVEGALKPSESVHVGLAISLRGGGLVAPAIRDTDRRSLDDLAKAVTDLVLRAREGRLRSSEMTEATLTVTSLGDRGVETVFGVIYPPQVAIVGFGRVTNRAWVDGGVVSVAPLVDVTLSGDHRANDGHRGGLFIQEIADRLQRPGEL